jgi:hypothetical protein
LGNHRAVGRPLPWAGGDHGISLVARPARRSSAVKFAVDSFLEEMDSNLQYRAVKGKFVPSASGSGWLQSRMWAAKITVLRHIPDVPGLGLEWDEKAVAAHLADNFQINPFDVLFRRGQNDLGEAHAHGEIAWFLMP